MSAMGTTHTLGKNREACTGCGACAAVCHLNCITMQPDSEGFLHPRVNTDICTDCGLCRQICPMNQAPSAELEKPDGQLQVFAAWHLDETIRYESSSGGVFTALAENILSQGGAVVGAAFDEHFIVRHIIVETVTKLHQLRGSKYVQSEFPFFIYHRIRDLLKHGRLVLFTGTPCQVAGLRNFLLKPYDNLFCCDLVCHGTPSPLLLSRYLHHIQMRWGKLNGFSFRDKTTGWKTCSIRLDMQKGHSRHTTFGSDPYASAFIQNYSLRPSCFMCKFSNVARCGDLTLGDFWGVAQNYPEYDHEDKGTSLVMVNTEKGKVWLDTCREYLFLGLADLTTAIERQVALVRSFPRPPERENFYRDLNTMSFSALVRKYRLHPESLFQRVLRVLKSKILC